MCVYFSSLCKYPSLSLMGLMKQLGYMCYTVQWSEHVWNVHSALTGSPIGTIYYGWPLEEE